jgi:Tfp pilus assembly protein PilF
MRVGVVRVFFAAASLLWLAGCETTSTGPDSLKSLASADTSAADPESTGSIKPPPGFLPGSPPRQPDLAGEDPNDDLNLGKKYFRQGSYGIAERHFRKAVERSPEDAESWMGLAASYDRLKRFDLADRAYGQATRLVGPTPEIMNNQGFSYMLRGDLARARTTLVAAQAKDPASPYIKNNMAMLAQMLRKAKGINQP